MDGRESVRREAQGTGCARSHTGSSVVLDVEGSSRRTREPSTMPMRMIGGRPLVRVMSEVRGESEAAMLKAASDGETRHQAGSSTPETT